MASLLEKDRIIKEKDRIIKEKNRMIEEKLAEKDRMIEEKLREKDRMIEDKLAEKDRMIEEKDKRLLEKDELIKITRESADVVMELHERMRIDPRRKWGECPSITNIFGSLSISRHLYPCSGLETAGR